MKVTDVFMLFFSSFFYYHALYTCFSFISRWQISCWTTTVMTSVTPASSTSESTNMAALQIKPRQLRIATYLCPSLPVELFQLIAEFLEEDLGCEASLLYEWRAAGPLPNRADPFADNTIDLGKYLPPKPRARYAWYELKPANQIQF